MLSVVEPENACGVFVAEPSAGGRLIDPLLMAIALVGQRKEDRGMSRLRNATIALSLGGAIAVTSMVPLGAPAVAAPLSMNAAALTEAAPSDVIDVRRRWHRHRRGAAVAGLALGVIGGIIAHEAYRRHYHYGYSPYYYYEPYPQCIRRYGRLYCR